MPEPAPPAKPQVTAIVPSSEAVHSAARPPAASARRHLFAGIRDTLKRQRPARSHGQV